MNEPSRNTIDRVSAWWQANCSDWPMTANEYKWMLPDRWVRFHSFDTGQVQEEKASSEVWAEFAVASWWGRGSKRWPDCEADFVQVETRQSAILDALCSDSDRELVLVLTSWGDNEGDVRSMPPWMCEVAPKSALWRAAERPGDSSDSEPMGWLSQWVRIEPPTSELLRVFRLTADDAIFNVVMFDLQGDWLAHP